MKKRGFLLPRAEFDEAEIYEYLAQRSAGTAQRFLDMVNETLHGLCKTSVPGVPWNSESPGASGLRWVKVRGFKNYLMFFRVSDEHIAVIRILHGARDLGALLPDE
jgi:toxin ParE1/3/4